MKIISIMNEKGGCGKTTIATNLAYSLSRRFNTVLIDSDPQGSARDWHQASNGAMLPVIGFDRETIDIDLKNISSQYDIAVIDCAPRVSRASTTIIKKSDLIVIPVLPSQYDIWACAGLVETIKAWQELQPKCKAVFLVSMAIKNTTLGRDVIEALEAYKLPIFKARTTRRESYKHPISEGKTVYQGRDDFAIHEIDELTDEVEGLA